MCAGFAASLVAVLTIVRWYEPSAAAPDFVVYRDAAGAAWHNANLYAINSASPGSGSNPFTYTPMAALVLLPTTWLDWRAGYLCWSLGSMLALAWVLNQFVPARLSRRPLALAGLIAVASTSYVVIVNIGFGQINIFLMALCLADLRRRNTTLLARFIPCGALVGLAAAIKLTPALFIVYFLVTRQFRLAWWSVVGAAASTLIAAFTYPTMTATFFHSTLWRLQDRVNLDHPSGFWGNNSLSGALAALGDWTHPLAVPLVFGLGCANLATARHVHHRGNDTDAWLIVGLTAPLITPFSWAHHFVYVLPALTRLAFTSDLRRRRRQAAVTAAAIATLALHWGPGPGQHWLQHTTWLLLPGVLMREQLLLVSLTCIALLARRANHPSNHVALEVKWCSTSPA